MLKLCALGYSRATQNCSCHQHLVLKSFSVCSDVCRLSYLFLSYVSIFQIIGGGGGGGSVMIQERPDAVNLLTLRISFSEVLIMDSS